MSTLAVKDGITTIAQDTLLVNVVNTFQHSANQQCFTVHTIAEPKSALELWGMWIGIILGVLTILFTLYSAFKLGQKNEDAQKQIDKLTKMSEVMLSRYRLLVKPRLYIGNSGFSGFDNRIHFNLNNRGELCYFDGYELLEGDKILFQEWQQAIEMPKEGKIKFDGKSLEVHPKDVKFKMKVMYHDQEDFKYESIIEWNGTPKIIETKE